MSKALDDLKNRWAKMSPRARAAVSVCAVLTIFMFLASLVVKPDPTKVNAGGRPGASQTNLLTPQRRDNTVEGLAGSVTATNSRLERIEQELKQALSQRDLLLKQLEEERKKPPPAVTSDIVREMSLIRSDLEALKRGRVITSTSATIAPKLNEYLPNFAPATSATSGTSTANAPTSAPPVETGPRLRVIGSAAASSQTKPSAPTEPVAFLPAGSFFEGVLINGMDAPTSTVTQKNPVPALVRVQSSAILPNRFAHDVRECFVVISGFGVLATERAQLRTESMSCIRANGEVIEAKLNGYVVGEDGKVGLRGRLVSKQGQVIAKSLVSGFLSGLSQNLTPTPVPQLNVNPGGSTQTQAPDLNAAFQSGVYGGAASAAKMVAQFYLDMAKDMFPVVEVDAARKVTIVLVAGVELLANDSNADKLHAASTGSQTRSGGTRP